MIRLLLVLGVMAAAPLTVGCASRDPVRLEDAWVRMADAGATTAAYFTLVNDTGEPVAVRSAEAPAATATELHETVREGGRMHMRPSERTVVGPRSRLRFEPGGHHLMLIGLREPLRAGTTTPLHVRLEDGRVIDAAALVRP